MVKSQLINAVAEKLPHLPYKDVDMSLNHLLDMMCESLCDGKRIEVRDFGCFTLRYRPPRNAHNPKTGEKVATIGKHAPHFKPGKELRDRVNSCYGQPMANFEESAED